MKAFKRYLPYINVVLVVVALGLTGVVMLGIGGSSVDSSSNGSPASSNDGRPVSVASLASNPGEENAYAVIGKQDLFRPEREPYHSPTPQPTPKPDEATPTPEGTPLPPPKNIKLTGILKLNRKRVALISESSIEQGRPQSYALGDELLAYRVDHIASTKVVLSSDEGEPIQLNLRDYENMFASVGGPIGGTAAQDPQARTNLRGNLNTNNDGQQVFRDENGEELDERTQQGVNKLLELMQSSGAVRAPNGGTQRIPAGSGGSVGNTIRNPGSNSPLDPINRFGNGRNVGGGGANRAGVMGGFVDPETGFAYSRQPNYDEESQQAKERFLQAIMNGTVDESNGITGENAGE